MEKDIFLERKKFFGGAVFIILLIFIASMKLSEFNIIKGILSIPNALVWMIESFIPNSDSLSRIGEILSKLVETILLSIAATTVGGVFAFIFGILGSRITKINNIFSIFSRMIASIFRNVPEAVWAMIFLLSFGQNILTGYFALFFVSFGTLTRAFIETIDETSESSVEALEATGASFLMIVMQGIIPTSMPQIISWILYMVETNIRSSTLIGILTGTGIGFLFDLYYKNMNYNVAGLIVISIIISVILIEILSNKIRRKIL
ncbi:phosphonate ABC transporter, permease PhnE [Clostridium thermobutyricum]|uniref:Phosphonate ABC transporter, permease PhnE n=1 Tax=Clostridium thermobutyricum TaxID=29372 RepID=N9WAJ0_9CLOT|nr:ABC transporter permease subunit [Clostridium thermobutyricum]ENY99919.1 phosphonate ABC transporter, permease PhnE [Clostridium thermobutyricum]